MGRVGWAERGRRGNEAGEAVEGVYLERNWNPPESLSRAMTRLHQALEEGSGCRVGGRRRDGDSRLSGCRWKVVPGFQQRCWWLRAGSAGMEVAQLHIHVKAKVTGFAGRVDVGCERERSQVCLPVFWPEHLGTCRCHPEMNESVVGAASGDVKSALDPASLRRLLSLESRCRGGIQSVWGTCDIFSGGVVLTDRRDCTEEFRQTGTRTELK